ncbi:MAG: tetratricopeptide repeat protein, partial [Candidatus Cryptobacteroides sp.]
QNEFHSPTPGDIFTGNWECGIGPIDRMRLGDQSDAPAYLKDNKGKNHYFLLPLLLGIIGIFFQFARDKRGFWVTFLMFFMTGIAIVIYLNQPPYQVRERDYAYAGSFYAFSIWIGFAVAAIYSWIQDLVSRKDGASQGVLTAAATAVSLCCLGVPVLMAQQNWDDHDRSNRRTAVEMAKNYLNSVGQNGILITHGDNDTFPLWYAQEVEEIRTDVRICNTSLLGTDWHIDQMKYACNESKPLGLSVGPEQYLYGTNEYIFIYDTRETVIPISTVMEVFRHPEAKLPLQSGRKVDYIMSRRISLPVNKENVLKYGILDSKYADIIPDEIVLNIPKDKEYLSKPELFMLDLLSNYQWDRPINMLNMGGDINMGIKEYLQYEGFSFKFVPIRNKMKQTDIGFADADDLYRKMTEVYTWDALKQDNYFVDYQNLYTFCGVMSQRGVFVNCAKEMVKAGMDDKAEELLDKCQECVPESSFPLDMSYLGFINEHNVFEMIATYYAVGASEKALDLAERFAAELMGSARFYFSFYDYAQSNFEETCRYIFYLADVLEQNGHKEQADRIQEELESLVSYNE